MKLAPFQWAALPRRSKIDAALARRAAALVPGARAGLSALAARLGISIRPTAVVARALSLPDRPGETVTILDERGERALVWIDGALIGPLGARMRGERDSEEQVEIAAPRKASAIERGLIAYLVGWALQSMAAPLLVEDVGGGVPWPGGGTVISVDLAVTVGAARGFVRVYAPPSLLVAPVRRWSHLVRERLPHAPVRLRVLAGWTRLEPHEVARIRPRSVVVLDELPPGLFVAVGAGGFSARRQEAAALITDIYRRGLPMSEPEESSDKDALARDLPIEVTCEIARLTLPAHEILGLAPGAVLPLGKRIGDPVDLVCAGRTIARGELVDLEGELGMRVLDET